MPDLPIDPDELVAALAMLQYGHLERRICSAESPMPMEDKDRYRWSHSDVTELGPFFNLVQFRCPHCGLVFACKPPPH